MAVMAEPETLAIWPGRAPGSEEWTHEEHPSFSPPPGRTPVVRNVARPTLTVYLPDPTTATGTGAIICPGGAFHFLAVEHEGSEVARWLTARGVAAFVLRYRVVPTPPDDETFHREWQAAGSRNEARRAASDRVRPLAIADGRQALRLVRERAADWGIVPERVGMVGFSAGAMLTCGVALDADPANRPAFAAPIYGAPREPVTVPSDAPPLFVAVAADDEMFSGASVRLYTAWRAAGRTAELHVYSRGGHGFGMRQRGLPADAWITQFHAWLGAEGFGG